MKRPKIFSWITQRRRGQALVEFSLSVAILALLLMGVIEFGMTLYTYIVVVDATDEAAAYASLVPYERDVAPCVFPCRLDNTADIIQRVRDATAGNAIARPDNYVAITVEPGYLERDPCATVEVSSRYHHRFLLPLFFGGSIDLGYSATKRIVPVGAWGICTP